MEGQDTTSTLLTKWPACVKCSVLLCTYLYTSLIDTTNPALPSAMYLVSYDITIQEAHAVLCNTNKSNYLRSLAHKILEP